MKLLSFTADGKASFGAMNDHGVITLAERIGQPTLRDALAAGALADMRKLAANAKPDHNLEEIKFLPVIPNPEKILCAGINYRAHAARPGATYRRRRAYSPVSPIRLSAMAAT
jgi:2-keto-4-pentenoate hydratase/2-oxohepta-3-ene-1,7-dioic acid hydratase in catechol pathway